MLRGTNFRSIGKPFLRGVLVVLVFMFISGVFSYAANVKYHDLGRDPMRVKVKKIIPIEYPFDISRFNIEALQGWSPDGKYLILGSTMIYDKNGKHVKDLPGEYIMFSPDGTKILTLEHIHDTKKLTWEHIYEIYDTKNWKLIKKFKNDRIFFKENVTFYGNSNYLIYTETYSSGKYTISKIIKYDYIKDKKELIHEEKDCEPIEELIYLPDDKLLYSKYYCDNSPKKGNAEYMLDLKTKKIKLVFREEIFRHEVYKDYKGRYLWDGDEVRYLDNFKIVAPFKCGKPVIDNDLLKYPKANIDYWETFLMPNLKLWLINIVTYNEHSEMGDYPLDSYIFIYDLKCKKRKMLKLKNPTVFPMDNMTFSPEGDRFAVIDDYKRFVIVVLEREGNREL